MKSHILVLNYNGKDLLAECLPSVVAAAGRIEDCAVSVVDNGSDDGSLPWLAEHYPSVGLFRSSNLGLVSFNSVLQKLTERVVLLLNNDVKLEETSIAPLLEPFERSDCFLSAPLCWRFDGRSYEAMLTRVRFRRGLVEASTQFPGHEQFIHQPGWTASAGPVLAVDREKFLALGGYDPLYLPGRLEDLDLCYRAWLAGWKAYYVPESVAYHKGFGSFHDAYGVTGCDQLALRNTLLFTWKNVRDFRRLAVHAAMLPIRVLHSCAVAAWTPGARRFLFCRALMGALGRLPAALRGRRSMVLIDQVPDDRNGPSRSHGKRLRAAEREFFARLGWSAAGGLR